MKTLAAHLAILTVAAAISVAAFSVHAAPATADPEIAALRAEVAQLAAIKRERSRAITLARLQARKAKLEAAIAAAAPTAAK